MATCSCITTGRSRTMPHGASAACFAYELLPRSYDRPALVPAGTLLLLLDPGGLHDLRVLPDIFEKDLSELRRWLRDGLVAILQVEVTHLRHLERLHDFRMDAV